MGKALRRITYFIAAAMISAAGVSAATVTPALAATCSGHGCDHQNPYGAGCSNGSEIIYDEQLNGATAHVRLWYSPSCRTVWASIYDAPAPDGTGEGYAEIHRNSDGLTLECQVQQGDNNCYTNMLYDGGVTSYAYGYYNDGDPGEIGSASTPSF